MKDYVLERVNQDNIDYLVLGTSVESPFFCLTEIAKDIKADKAVKVLFDQLLQTGDSKIDF